MGEIFDGKIKLGGMYPAGFCFREHNSTESKNE